MFDLEIVLGNEPGQLALMGETLGASGVSVEGGGMWLVGEVGVAHFLVDDPNTAVQALSNAGIEVVASREVLTQRLDQNEPGQLGKFCRVLADSGVNIEVLYSDHDNQLIVAVDQMDVARPISESWESGAGE